MSEKPRILLVDDEKVVLDLLVEILELLGFTGITLTASSNEAITLLESQVFTHVICDGLLGKWADVFRVAFTKQIPFLLYSNHETYLEIAESKAIPKLSKLEDLTIIEATLLQFLSR